MWEATFDHDPIDLTPLQTRARILKARALIRRLAAGECWTTLGGKRRRADRDLVAIPIGLSFRLLVRVTTLEVRPVACMTHEAYNGLRAGAYESEVRRGC